MLSLYGWEIAVGKHCFDEIMQMMKPNYISLSDLIVQFVSVSLSLGTGQEFLKGVMQVTHLMKIRKLLLSHI